MDKVRCPWCGNEMFYFERKTKGYGVMGYYLCRACEARAPRIDNIRIDAADMKDAAFAAAMRRYVEPLKPLPLDELTTIEESTPIYVLHRYGEWRQNGWHIWEPRPDDRDCETSDTQNYGITWDAYLRRPNDEERQSVAWEESQ